MIPLNTSRPQPFGIRGFFSRRLLALLCLACLCVVARAHVGNPNVYLEAEAGPYQARVIIQPPPVVPGLAQIHVRLLRGHPQKVAVLPARWDTGRKGSPPPDEAKPVPGETNLYTASLWLMNSGAYSVFVDLVGPSKTETIIVPLNSLATRRLGMSPVMGWAFALFGAGLFVALVVLVGAAVRESVVPPGEKPSQRRRLLGRVAMAVATVAAGSLLLIGRSWWNDVDGDFRRNKLYRTSPLESSVGSGADGPTLEMKFGPPPPRPRDTTPLIPDHGKIMHAFLAREPALDAFAHLHPTSVGKGEFRSLLPPLPPGTYRIYADVTRESGFTETFVSSLEMKDAVPAANPFRPGDADDAWLLPEGAAPAGDTFPLPGGFKLVWARPELRAGVETVLRFKAATAEGAPVLLEPYLEMYGHAVIMREDGSVFTHLHPSGTYSVASQKMFLKREPDAASVRPAKDVVCGRPDEDLLFPCEFPKPGAYRVWVQVKIRGRILTAVFRASVAEPGLPR